MLYIAFMKNKPGTVLGNVDIMDKSKKWWNEGDSGHTARLFVQPACARRYDATHGEKH